tara:strand:+ start:382 stop:822 length:441 start_codon:yes stop_codon:yes gene_type:complete
MRSNSRDSKSGIGESIRVLLAEAKAVANESNNRKAQSSTSSIKKNNDRLGLSIVQNKSNNISEFNESLNVTDRLGLKNVSRIQHKNHLKEKININNLSEIERKRLIGDAVSEILKDSLKPWIKNNMPEFSRKTIKNILGVRVNKEN